MVLHRSTLVWLAVALLLVVGAANSASAEDGLPAVRSQPDAFWSSGWQDLTKVTCELSLSHNLGGDPATYAAELWFRDTNSGGLGIHTRHFGGNAVGSTYPGAAWDNLTSALVRVLCFDVVAVDDKIDQIYLRLWHPDLPAWDSGWQTVGQGVTRTFNHNLGGNVDDYVVGMRFDNEGSFGINQVAYGGVDDNGAKLGAVWLNLTNSSIQVRRFAHDSYAKKVRVQIYLPTIPPAYDSGWQAIGAGSSLVLDHNVGGDVDDYVVRFSTRSTALGINTLGAGGKDFAGKDKGAHWQRLTNASVTVHRWPDDDFGDDFAEQVRVRIFLQTQAAQRVYLPLITSQ